MEIVMARGDMTVRTFAVQTKDKLPFTDQFDNIFLTVKKTAEDREFKFQKRLNDGSGIESLGGGKYRFTILPEDTNGLPYGRYVFDIELLIAGALKKTFLGTLELTKEATHSYNEE